MLCWQQVRMQLVLRHVLNADYYLQCVVHCFPAPSAAVGYCILPDSLQNWCLIWWYNSSPHFAPNAPNGADARHQWLACELLILESMLMVLQKGLHAVAG